MKLKFFKDFLFENVDNNEIELYDYINLCFDDDLNFDFKNKRVKSFKGTKWFSNNKEDFNFKHTVIYSTTNAINNLFLQDYISNYLSYHIEKIYQKVKKIDILNKLKEILFNKISEIDVIHTYIENPLLISNYSFNSNRDFFTINMKEIKINDIRYISNEEYEKLIKLNYDCIVIESLKWLINLKKSNIVIESKEITKREINYLKNYINYEEININLKLSKNSFKIYNNDDTADNFYIQDGKYFKSGIKISKNEYDINRQNFINTNYPDYIYYKNMLDKYINKK